MNPFKEPPFLTSKKSNVFNILSSFEKILDSKFSGMKKFFKNKWVKGVLIVLLALVFLAGGLYWWNNEPLPKGEAGAKADALAKKMMQAVDVEAWNATGAVSWNFAESRQHIWDKERHFAQVTWQGNVVLVNNHTQTGIVKQKASGNKKSDAELVREAWEIWVNDSFWLNPIAKLFDPGTVRELVSLPSGEEALLITYQSGGATPGDAYLWIVDKEGLPRAWKLWVSIIPIGGLEFSWEKWQTTSTGFKVATLHQSALKDLSLTEVKAAKTLQALTQEKDIFEELVKKDK